MSTSSTTGTFPPILLSSIHSKGRQTLASNRRPDEETGTCLRDKRDKYPGSERQGDMFRSCMSVGKQRVNRFLDPPLSFSPASLFIWSSFASKVERKERTSSRNNKKKRSARDGGTKEEAQERPGVGVGSSCLKRDGASEEIRG